MTLELERVAAALPRVVAAAEAHQRRNGELAALARRTLGTAMSVEQIRERVIGSGRQEALAIPLEPPSLTHAAPPLDAYTVIAADGSHHELERYSATPCAIVNLGGWRIRYPSSDTPPGNAEDIPDGLSLLRAGEAEQLYDLRVLTTETFILDSGQIVDGTESSEHADAAPARAATNALLGAYRGAWETVFLAERTRLALADPSSEPLVALLDGVLLPWTVPGTDEGARHQVARMYTNAMSDLRASIDGRRAAVGSYISHPRAGEVMAMLSLLSPDADGLAGHADMLVFGPLLGPGERSASFETFTSRESWPQQEHFGKQGHRTGFFYVNTAANEGEPGEIARVEFPTWLAEREGTLDLLHAAVLDQCRRNGGYPIALQEAHERAVLTTGDRLNFEAMIERELASRGIIAATAGKQMSKRARRL